MTDRVFQKPKPTVWCFEGITNACWGQIICSIFYIAHLPMILTVPKYWEYDGTYVLGKYLDMQLVMVLCCCGYNISEVTNTLTITVLFKYFCVSSFFLVSPTLFQKL